MAVPADQAVADTLVAAAIGLTLGTNLFRGEVKPPKQDSVGAFIIPHEAVFCLLTGGPSPRSQVAENAGPDIREPTVQVRVRGDVGAFEAGQTLAESVWKALQRAVVLDYMSVIVRESAPEPIGQDATNHPEWTMNIETMLEY